MVKFIVIEKNFFFKFIFFISLTILLFLTAFLFLKKDGVLSSFIPSNIHSDINKDFDGDGTIDSLIADKSDSNYVIKIKTNNGEYILQNDIYGPALIDNYPSFDIKIDALDLSRNGIPEIILTGFKNISPITYIYKWKDSEFIEVFSTTNNIFGLLDFSNSRTPKILYTLSDKGDEATNSFIFNGNIIKDITFSKPQIPSLGVIQKFIDLIQVEYEITETPGLFSSYINSNELSLLWTLSKDTFRYAFQTGSFRDISWDKNGFPTSLLWTLSFEKVNSLDSSKPREEIIFSVKTVIDQFGEYKISSIKKL